MENARQYSAGVSPGRAAVSPGKPGRGGVGFGDRIGSS